MKNLSQYITESFVNESSLYQHPTILLDQNGLAIYNEEGPFKLSEAEKLKISTVFLLGAKGLTKLIQKYPNNPQFFNSGYKGLAFYLVGSNSTYCLIYNPGKVHAEDHVTGSISLVQGRNTIWSVGVTEQRSFGSVGLEQKHFNEAAKKFKEWLKSQKK